MPVPASDPWRPAFHFSSPVNWLNDPNGLIQFKGKYHLFYQHHPFGVDWGPMHWGHAVSTDLMRWTHEPIALAPKRNEERDGCFSGSAVDDGGVLTLIYTGHTRESQTQCIATSADGVNFEKLAGNPVIAALPDGTLTPDFRDPKVWKHGDSWWLVAGTKRGALGQILLYASPDLRTWTFKSIVAESDGTLGSMWECPDLFPLGDRHLLVISPMGLDRPRSLFLTGSMDYAAGKFTQQSVQDCDSGFDFYAPQTFLDHSGRRILIAWMDNWASKLWPTKANGWCGAMTIPRVVTLLSDGTVAMEPVPELQTLRRKHVHFDDLKLPAAPLHQVSGDCLEIAATVDLKRTSAQEFGFSLRCSADGAEATRVYYSRAEGKLLVDRTKSGAGDGGIYGAKLSLEHQDTLRLRIIVDRSSVEVFAQEGRVAITNRIYPQASSIGVSSFATGGEAVLKTFDAWELRS